MTSDEPDENVVFERLDGLNEEIAQQFVGETVGLFLQRDYDGFDADGDSITSDSTTDDITTEPICQDYGRVVLKNGMNPTFDVRDCDGYVDAVFFVDDDGELLGASPLSIPIDMGVDNLAEVTPTIFPDAE